MTTVLTLISVIGPQETPMHCTEKHDWQLRDSGFVFTSMPEIKLKLFGILPSQWLAGLQHEVQLLD